MDRRMMALMLAAAPALGAAARQEGEGLPACTSRIETPGVGRATVRLYDGSARIDAWLELAGEYPHTAKLSQNEALADIRGGLTLDQSIRVDVDSSGDEIGPRRDVVLNDDVGTLNGRLTTSTPLHRGYLRSLLSGESMDVSWRNDAGEAIHTQVRLDPQAFRRFNDEIAATLRELEDQNGRTCAAQEQNCYLTTAAVGAVGLADDCWELMILRRFRDRVLARAAGGQQLIEDYYRRAPGIVERVSIRPDARTIWLRTYAFGVLPCAVLARAGLSGAATRLYRRMTRRLEGLAPETTTAAPVAGSGRRIFGEFV